MDLDRPSLRVDQSGARPLVSKHATSTPAVNRLRAELGVLRRAQHPGVVTLVDSTDDDEGVTIRTRYCGSRTLQTIGALTVGRAAGVVAALAATVADLHELGIAHRRITADHVLIASDGRPVLCGFGDASADAEDLDFAEDVRCLGTLLSEVLAPLDDAAPIPTSRLGRRGAWSGYQRRALLNLADQATADDRLVRPSARQFAQNLRSTVPDAHLAEESETSPSADDGGHGVQGSGIRTDLGRLQRKRRGRGESGAASRRLTVAGLGAAGLVLFATMVVATNASARDTGPATPKEPPTELAAEFEDNPARRPFGDSIEATPFSERAPQSPVVPGADERSGDERLDERQTAIERAGGCDVDPSGSDATLANGSPCPVEMTVDGGILDVADHAFQLDIATPAVAIGRFACGGEVRAAVLDLDDGSVFVFDRWADDDDRVTAAALTTIDQARRLLAEPFGSNCHRLVALDAFGIRHVVDVPVVVEAP